LLAVEWALTYFLRGGGLQGAVAWQPVPLPSDRFADTRGGSMRECRPYGFVRGARGEAHVPTAISNSVHAPCCTCSRQHWHIAIAASCARASGSPRGYNGHSSIDVRAPPLLSGSRPLAILDRTLAWRFTSRLPSVIVAAQVLPVIGRRAGNDEPLPRHVDAGHG
jgi:hypothetical protein